MSKIISFLCALALFCSCTQNPPRTEPSSKPLVLVSVGPYQLFAQRIGGQHIDVQSLVPPGTNVHVFEPTPRSRDTLKRGAVWFRIGEPFENPLIPLLQHQLRIVDLRDGIELIPLHTSCCHHCNDHFDRHIWTNPLLVQEQARAITEALSQEFPEHREEFDHNLQTLLLDLTQLDQDIRSLLHSTPRTLLVSHPAFGYFCKEYSLTQLSVEEEGKDPRPKHLESLLTYAGERKPDVAITLPQHNNKGAQIIAEKLHIPVAMIDPYSVDYFDSMLTLAQWIAKHP